jgi:hypothetical protein
MLRLSPDLCGGLLTCFRVSAKNNYVFLVVLTVRNSQKKFQPVKDKTVRFM